MCDLNSSPRILARALYNGLLKIFELVLLVLEYRSKPYPSHLLEFSLEGLSESSSENLLGGVVGALSGVPNSVFRNGSHNAFNSEPGMN